jgi:hypothetical protein
VELFIVALPALWARVDDPGQAEAVGDGTFAAADPRHLLGCQIDASLPGPS